jgi:Tfp pilus assembly pilus retraction ATPase PilT
MQKDVHKTVYDIMNDKQRKAYQKLMETDFSFKISQLARARVNTFNQSRSARGVSQHSDHDFHSQAICQIPRVRVIG